MGPVAWPSVSKADLITATAEYPNCPQQKPTQTSHYSTILQEINQLTGGTLITLNHCSRNLEWIQICLPADNAFFKTIIHGLI